MDEKTITHTRPPGFVFFLWENDYSVITSAKPKKNMKMKRKAEKMKKYIALLLSALMPESTRGSGRLVLCGNAARLNRCILGCAGELFSRPAVLSPYPEDAAAGAAKLAGALV